MSESEVRLQALMDLISAAVREAGGQLYSRQAIAVAQILGDLILNLQDRVYDLENPPTEHEQP